MDTIPDDNTEYTTVRIPTGLMEDFKAILRERYGNDHGLISITVETLIREFVADRSPAIARTDKLKVLYQKLLDMERSEIFERDLVRLIMDTFQIIDQRSIKNYTFSMETLGFISKEKRGRLEVYKVNPKKI